MRMKTRDDAIRHVLRRHSKMNLEKLEIFTETFHLPLLHTFTLSVQFNLLSVPLHMKLS